MNLTQAIGAGSMSTGEREAALRALTKEEVQQFEFVAHTPAHGFAYYSYELDIAAIVYRQKTRIFYNRVGTGTGKYASCFSDNLEIAHKGRGLA